jgi:hypothetical protein
VLPGTIFATARDALQVTPCAVIAETPALVMSPQSRIGVRASLLAAHVSTAAAASAPSIMVGRPGEEAFMGVSLGVGT